MDRKKERQLFENLELAEGENYEDVLRQKVVEYLQDGYILSSLTINPYEYLNASCIYTKTDKISASPLVVVREDSVKEEQFYETILAVKMLQMQAKGYDLAAASYVPYISGSHCDKVVSVFIYKD